MAARADGVGQCDLCQSSDARVAIELPFARSLRSDRVVVPRRLVKLSCAACGLLRADDLGVDVDSLYAHEYAPPSDATEHHFYTPRGPRPRSEVLYEWIRSAFDDATWAGLRRCMEVGAGSGHLLATLAARDPGKEIAGVEPSAAGAARARARGLDVTHGTLDRVRGRFDLVIAVAVLEHVASPTRFLRQIAERLPVDGRLVLCQPTQDVASYDVLFVDHLHHFGTAHLTAYAEKCGFREEHREVGHELMPSFSLHVWRRVAAAPLDLIAPHRVPIFSLAAARTLLRDFARFDATLDALVSERRSIAPFGLSEVYWLARAYTRLDDAPLVCGLDDAPDRPEYGHLPFPVVRPEDAPGRGVTDVLLTMNRIYYEMARARVERLGMRPHELLSGGDCDEETPQCD